MTLGYMVFNVSIGFSKGKSRCESQRHNVTSYMMDSCVCFDL